MWSAYKMKQKGLISKAVKVYKDNGTFVPNPQVITDKYLKNGDIVYGNFLTGEAGKAAREKAKGLEVDFSLLDKEVGKILWIFTNLFPNCLMKSIDGIRHKKKFFWDQTKLANRHWLAANMQGEAYLGFHAFNTKKITGQDVIDFVKYRQLTAEGYALDEDFFEQVLGKPQE